MDKLIMMFEDLKYKHINPHSNSNVLYVTFAAWNIHGKPNFFGESFFLGRNIETVLISQKGINHWWHTDEILEIAEFVKQRAKKNGKKVILYGSSMGGYGVCHFRKLFSSYLAIAIAPQIFINDKYHPEQHTTGGNGKALEEKVLLQDSFRFDEVNNLSKQVNYPLYVYFDPYNRADSSHVECYKKNITASDSVYFLKVPYTNHDVARALNKAKFLEKIILKSNELSIMELQSIVEKTYLYDSKTYMNYLRKSTYPLSENHLNLFEKYLSTYNEMDFEALYMAAEILMKLGRHKEAIYISMKSIETYNLKYSKRSPKYLKNKFLFVVKQALKALG